MTYQAPVDDILFALKTAANLDDAVYDGLDIETISAIVTEAGAFGADVLAPLNWTGDRVGSKWSAGEVKTPDGFRDAYRRFAEGGWSALPCPEEYGGQGLPEIMTVACGEIWNAANISFGLCPLLTQGAIHAIEAGGADALKAKFLPKMASGAWTGTMNLTEPHAGSDLSPLTTKAVKQDDGTYKITGTKIFITWGEHDLAENIIHLVLARLPDAPAGTRGISLFVAPKYLINDDGSLGERNDLVCAGVEHKLGIMASPTCVMKFGEKGGATAYLIGEENRGLATMFVMMNAARLQVGVQGVAVADRATQRAIEYAKERKQGKSGKPNGAGMIPIIEHADIRRTLLTMKATTQAARMICFATAYALDVSHRASDPTVRKSAEHRAGLLTPIAKAFSTDIGVEIASMGIQVHGGMGFVEETGAAQHWRDSRILPIYEGTNGIQAIDLVTRKLPLDGGAAVKSYLAEIDATIADLKTSNWPDLGEIAERLREGLKALGAATAWIGDALNANPEAALAGATPYLRLFGTVSGAGYLARGALSADAPATQTALARFFAENVLTAAPGLAATVMRGAGSVLSEDATAALA